MSTFGPDTLQLKQWVDTGFSFSRSVNIYMVHSKRINININM